MIRSSTGIMLAVIAGLLIAVVESSHASEFNFDSVLIFDETLATQIYDADDDLRHVAESIENRYLQLHILTNELAGDSQFSSGSAAMQHLQHMLTLVVQLTEETRSYDLMLLDLIRRVRDAYRSATVHAPPKGISSKARLDQEVWLRRAGTDLGDHEKQQLSLLVDIQDSRLALEATRGTPAPLGSDQQVEHLLEEYSNNRELAHAMLSYLLSSADLIIRRTSELTNSGKPWSVEGAHQFPASGIPLTGNQIRNHTATYEVERTIHSRGYTQ